MLGPRSCTTALSFLVCVTGQLRGFVLRFARASGHEGTGEGPRMSAEVFGYHQGVKRGPRGIALPPVKSVLPRCWRSAAAEAWVGGLRETALDAGAGACFLPSLFFCAPGSGPLAHPIPSDSRPARPVLSRPVPSSCPAQTRIVWWDPCWVDPWALPARAPCLDSPAAELSRLPPLPRPPQLGSPLRRVPCFLFLQST